ncbi:DUF397 domain-containing protein [Sphaerisporangium rubeum]|uniref:DUF397 domain-containing protein n=1 Tax=Sphaerisporangium rubeum TaxID=321317 RepID=UPI0031B5675C
MKSGWRRSSFSGHDGSNCVEVANVTGGNRAVRDSKDLSRPAVVCSSEIWATFLGFLKGPWRWGEVRMDEEYQRPGTRWRRSSYSGDDGSNCVEVAVLSGARRALRDSKSRGVPAIVFTSDAWRGLLDHLRGR